MDHLSPRRDERTYIPWLLRQHVFRQRRQGSGLPYLKSNTYHLTCTRRDSSDIGLECLLCKYNYEIVKHHFFVVVVVAVIAAVVDPRLLGCILVASHDILLNSIEVIGFSGAGIAPQSAQRDCRSSWLLDRWIGSLLLDLEEVSMPNCSGGIHQNATRLVTETLPAGVIF